jgi:hypothetical protein
MGCHLGWYSSVGCPLSENKYKKGASSPPKTIKEKKIPLPLFPYWAVLCATAQKTNKKYKKGELLTTYVEKDTYKGKHGKAR